MKHSLTSVVQVTVSLAAMWVTLGSVEGEEIAKKAGAEVADERKAFPDEAKALQSGTPQAHSTPKGDSSAVTDRNQTTGRNKAEETKMSDSSVLKFLNFGMKELGQPSISMEQLGVFRVDELPKEYFIVLDRQGDQHALSEWVQGEFIRIRPTQWEAWRPANKLLKENVISGKMVFSEPGHKFMVMLTPDGELRSALLKIKDRVWAINLSRRDGLSPAIPLVPEELFFEYSEDRGNDTKVK